MKAGQTSDKCSKPCLSLHDFFFFSLITHFVPPALSLHIRLPSSHLHLSCTCVTRIPHFLSASILFVRCYARHTHTLPLFPRSTFSAHVSLNILSLRLRWCYTRHLSPFLSELYPNPICPFSFKLRLCLSLPCVIFSSCS